MPPKTRSNPIWQYFSEKLEPANQEDENSEEETSNSTTSNEPHNYSSKICCSWPRKANFLDFKQICLVQICYTIYRDIAKPNLKYRINIRNAISPSPRLSPFGISFKHKHFLLWFYTKDMSRDIRLENIVCWNSIKFITEKLSIFVVSVNNLWFRNFRFYQDQEKDHKKICCYVCTSLITQYITNIVTIVQV